MQGEGQGCGQQGFGGQGLGQHGFGHGFGHGSQHGSHGSQQQLESTNAVAKTAAIELKSVFIKLPLLLVGIIFFL